MKTVSTSKFTNSLDEMGVDSQSSKCLNEESNYVIPPSYNANQSNVENDNYAALQDTRWNETDYQQLNG